MTRRDAEYILSKFRVGKISTDSIIQVAKELDSWLFFIDVVATPAYPRFSNAQLLEIGNYCNNTAVWRAIISKGYLSKSQTEDILNRPCFSSFCELGVPSYIPPDEELFSSWLLRQDHRHPYLKHHRKRSSI